MKRTEPGDVKVLQVLTRMGAGGPPVAVLPLTRELNRSGYDTLLATGQCEQIDLDMSYLLTPEDRVEWIPEMSRSVRLRSDVVALWRLYRLMRKMRPTIVQTHTAKAGALGRAAARLAGVPIVVHTFHGHVMSGYFSPTVSRAIRMIERMLAKWTDAIFVLAPQQERDLVERFGVASRRQVRVIPLGLDLTPFQKVGPAPRTDGYLTVGWLGRMAPVKNVPLLLQVAEETLRRNDRIRFLVAGDGQERELVAKVSDRWGDRFQWIGWQKNVTPVIERCHLLLQTSRNEGTPVALIQGMAAGRPFLSTPAGGVVDMVTGSPLQDEFGCRWYSNAVLTDAGPSAFASALCEFQAQPALLDRMGRCASELAFARYNLDVATAAYQRVYAELIAARAKRAPARVALRPVPKISRVAENS